MYIYILSACMCVYVCVCVCVCVRARACVKDISITQYSDDYAILFYLKSVTDSVVLRNKSD